MWYALLLANAAFTGLNLHLYIERGHALSLVMVFVGLFVSGYCVARSLAQGRE